MFDAAAQVAAAVEVAAGGDCPPPHPPAVNTRTLTAADRENDLVILNLF